MDMPKVLALNPVERFSISWKGNEEVKKSCETRLISYFEQTIASWRRQGRQSPFPLHVKFYLKFVPFQPEMLFDLSKSIHVEWQKYPLLHFFFIKPATVDEYRSGTRNEVSEWFSMITQLNSQPEWLIVFDSSEAREKKNRGALMERIKSDFAKYINRIIEIHDGSSQTLSSLQSVVQMDLLNSLDIFVSNEETYLTNAKQHFTAIDFNFIAYCQHQMEISQLYNSLGLLESVLAKYDEMSFNISHFVKLDNKPGWLCNKPYLGEGCPLLAGMAQLNKPIQQHSLIEIRLLILAHQIVTSLRLFDERIRQQSSENVPASAIQMKSDFAAILLRYSYNCIASICEEIAILKLEIDAAQLQCWILVYCIETMQFVSLLTQAAHLENASHFACALSTRKCNAMTELGECLEGDDAQRGTKLLEWFEKGVQCCGTEIANQSNAVAEIRQILSDQQQFSHYMQKYHESSIALLKHFGWKRQSKLLGWHLANFLLASDRVEGALPYLLKFISGLIREGASALLLEKTVALVVEHLEASPHLYLKELIDFYIILSTSRYVNETNRVHHCRRLFEILERNGSTKLRRSIRSTTRYSALSCDTRSVPCRLTSTPGSTIHITLTITNRLPLPVEHYRIRCVFKAIPTGCTRQQTNAGRCPLFECSFNPSDSVNRFGCVWKGEYGMLRRDSINEQDDFPSSLLIDDDGDEAQKSICFEEEEKEGEQGDRTTSPEDHRKLEPGDNIVDLYANIGEVGVYMLESIEIKIYGVLYVTLSWMDIPEIEYDNQKRPICFVHRKSPSVHLQDIKGGHALSGVTQRLTFELASGSEGIADSGSTFEISSPNIEFWNEKQCKWCGELRIELDPMDANINRYLAVYVCKSIRNLLSNQQDDTAETANNDRLQPIICTENICVKWLNKEWSFVVEFCPIMSIHTKTSLLEDKILYEMQISRTAIDNGWIMLPQEAILVEANQEGPQIPARLLNPKLTPIVPMSTYRLVWILASGKRNRPIEAIEHEIRLLYRLKQSNGFDSDIPANIYDREYEYVEEVAFKVETASYELCAQILSSQPGAVLCRVDNACDLIVSLRSLTNKVETVVIGIEADAKFWSLHEKHKLLYVKESGLGQISFSIVPKMVGFLPYPSVSVFCCHHIRTPSDKSLTHIEQNMFGERLTSFIRTKGKQIHVLGAFNPSVDQKSTSSSEKSGRLKEAKNRLTKLFD